MTIELWQGIDIIDFDNQTIDFSFVPVSVGQMNTLLENNSGVFRKKTNDELKIQLSFVITIESQSGQQSDGQYKIDVLNGSEVIDTECFDFYISGRSGNYNVTNHLFANIRASTNFEFTINIQNIFSSSFVKFNISDIKFFALQGIELDLFEIFADFRQEAFNPAFQLEALNADFAQEAFNPNFQLKALNVNLNQEAKEAVNFNLDIING